MMEVRFKTPTGGSFALNVESDITIAQVSIGDTLATLKSRR